MNVSRRQFEVFKAECDRWIEFFNLNDWEVYYKKVEDDENRGSIIVDVSARTANIYLMMDWGNHPVRITDEEVKKVAFHEACELLLSPIMYMVGQRYDLSESNVVGELHGIIRTFENRIFEIMEHSSEDLPDY